MASSGKNLKIKPLDKRFHANILMAIQEDDLEAIVYANELDEKTGAELPLSPESKIAAFKAVLAKKEDFEGLKQKLPPTFWEPMEKLHGYLHHPCPQKHFNKGGLFALVALEDKKNEITATAEQVHQYLRDLIASKIQEIEIEQQHRKSSAEFNEEKIPALLKKEYALLTKENEKIAFILELMKCSTITHILNRYQYNPGGPDALANINALLQDLKGTYKAFVNSSHPLLDALDRIKKVEENIIAAKKSFDELDPEDKPQFIFAISKRKFFAQIDYLSKPYVKAGLEGIQSYLQKTDQVSNKEQLLQAIEIASAVPLLLLDRSFKELKETEKTQFIFQLIKNDNPDEVLSLLNLQYNKGAENLELIEEALSKTAEKPEQVQELIKLVRSTPDLLKSSLSDLKPQEQKQFIHGLLALPSIERRKLLFAQYLKNKTNIELVAGWLAYPKSGSKFFNLLPSSTGPDNHDKKYDGHYVLSHYDDGQDNIHFRRRLRLHYFTPDLESKRVEIRAKDYVALRETVDRLAQKSKASPEDIYHGIILNAFPSYSRKPSLNDYFFSKNHRDCLQELSIIEQTGVLDEKTNPLSSSAKLYKDVFGRDARQQFVLQFLMLPPDQRRLALINQYNHDPQNIRELLVSLTARGAHREDFYKTFEAYGDFLHEVRLLANADELLNREFATLNYQDRVLFFVALASKPSNDRLFIMNKQFKINGENLYELQRFFNPDLYLSAVPAYQAEAIRVQALYQEKERQDINNETRALEKISYQNPLKRLHFMPFSDALLQGTDSKDHLQKYSSNESTMYAHSKYFANSKEYNKATLFKIAYVIGLLQVSSYYRNQILRQHGPESAELLFKWIEQNPKLTPLFNRFGSLKILIHILNEIRLLDLKDEKKAVVKISDPRMSTVPVPKNKQQTEAARARQLAALRKKDEVPIVEEDSKARDAYLDSVTAALLAIITQNKKTVGLIIAYFHSVQNVDKLIENLKKNKWVAEKVLDEFKPELVKVFNLVKESRFSSRNLDDCAKLLEMLSKIEPKLIVDDTKLENALQQAKLLSKPPQDEKETKGPALMAEVLPNREADCSHRIDDIYISKEGDYLKAVQVGDTGAAAAICSITGQRAEQQDRAVVGEASFCHLLEEKQIDKVLQKTSEALHEKCGNPGEGLEEVGSAMTASVAWYEKDATSGKPNKLHVHVAQIGSSSIALVKKDKQGKISVKLLTKDSEHTRKNDKENKRIVDTTKKNHEIESPTRVGEERLGAGFGAKMTRGLGNIAYEQDGLLHAPHIVSHTVPLLEEDGDCQYSLLLLSEGMTEDEKNEADREKRALERFEKTLQKKSNEHAPFIDVVYEITEDAYTNMKSTNNMTSMLVPIVDSPIFSAVFNGNSGPEVADAAAKCFSHELNSRIQIEVQENIATEEAAKRRELAALERRAAAKALDELNERLKLKLVQEQRDEKEERKEEKEEEKDQAQIKELKQICNTYLLKLLKKQQEQEQNNNQNPPLQDNKEQKDDRLNDKIEGMRRLIAKLDDHPPPNKSRVDAFKDQLVLEKDKLSIRRDDDWTTFYKCVLTALSIPFLLVGVGYFAIKKIWRVEGKEVAKELNKKSEHKPS